MSIGDAGPAQARFRPTAKGNYVEGFRPGPQEAMKGHQLLVLAVLLAGAAAEVLRFSLRPSLRPVSGARGQLGGCVVLELEPEQADGDDWNGYRTSDCRSGPIRSGVNTHPVRRSTPTQVSRDAVLKEA